MSVESEIFADAPLEVPSDVAAAAENRSLGAFRRAYVQRDRPGSKKAVALYTMYEFADGFVYRSMAKPHTIFAFAWRTVSKIYLGGQQMGGSGKFSITYRYSLYATGGRHVTLNGTFEQFVLSSRERRKNPDNEERDLYYMLSGSRQIVAQHLLPSALAALDAGRAIIFDDLRVGDGGLRTKTELVPWASIRSVKVVNGDLVVKASGRVRPVVQLSLYQMPNELLFLALAEHLLKKHGA